MNIVIKILKFVVAFAIIPVAIAATKSFMQAFGRIGADSNLYELVMAGFFIYPMFHIAVIKPRYIYVLGHEVVHVLATWLCGGQVTSFHVSSSGGTVGTTKSNFFTNLSPYFVPIHTIFLALVYWVLSRFFNIGRFSGEFVFLLGFTMSFHIFMTIETLKIRQPDMARTGYFFSVVFIYLANIIVALAVVSLIFRDISAEIFFKNTWAFSKNIYQLIFRKLFL